MNLDGKKVWFGVFIVKYKNEHRSEYSVEMCVAAANKQVAHPNSLHFWTIHN